MTDMGEDNFPPGADAPASDGAETLDEASSRLMAVQRLDPALYRVVEVTRQANGRLARQGQIWHSDLAMARRFGRVLAANSVAQKVQVADADGQVIETIPPPPPGAPAPGWGDWRALPLPPAPRLPRRSPTAAAPAKAALAARPPPPAAVPAALPVMAPENEVERTSTLTP